MPTTWAILTGEYPPQPGGVSDYTRQVAEGLAARGDVVHVFAPRFSAATDSMMASPPRVFVHPLEGNFNRASRAEARAIIQGLPAGTRILVQYVPHAFGMKAMNVGFARWVSALGDLGFPIDVMFHEVAFPILASQPISHRFLAFVTRRMAKAIAGAATRIFISIPAWEKLLHELGITKSMRWLPVPANIALQANSARVAQIRSQFGNSRILGHFGTYGTLVTAILKPAMIAIADQHSDLRFLLIGREGIAWTEAFRQQHPRLSHRVHATGELGADDVANHLAACDLAFQPYPDGINSRRGSAMASLALGVPVVTCQGRFTEPIWKISNAVFLAADETASSLSGAVRIALASSEQLLETGARGKALYESTFSLQNTLAAL